MLKIEGLSKNFGKMEVLKQLDLAVQDGSIYGLVGINGAGKSTLLRCIAGVYEPETGSVKLNGHDTFHDVKIRKKIAFVSDEQYYPIGSTILTLRQMYESLYDFDHDAYEKYMKLFELDEKASVLNLSKGNKRRVALVMALSTKPDLLLLDEAYDGLEPLVRYRFRQVLAELVEEGVSVIISSHNLKELEDICDSFGILDGGRILTHGDLEESKEQINRYQVAFNTDSEQNFGGFDILHVEREGRVYRLVIRGKEEEVMEKLKEMNPVLVDVLPVNFEELFIYELEGRSKHDQ